MGEEIYDFVVIGTGLTESMLAGALSQNGKTVLHLDKADRYGGEYCVFNGSDLLHERRAMFEYSFIDFEEDTIEGLTEKGEDLTAQLFSPLDKDSATFKRHGALISSILSKSRDFNIDLLPKLLYSRGQIIELLVGSGVGPSLEFQLLSSISILQNGKILKTPGSKEDVFSDQSISLIDKRRLMKFLTFALEFDGNEHDELAEQSFTDFLKKEAIPDNLITVIIAAIAFVTDVRSVKSMNAFDGVKRVKEHLSSIGKYGNGAFLTGIYGTGSELCQAFCRYAAIFGAGYILDFPLSKITIESEHLIVSSLNDERFLGKRIILGSEHANLLLSSTRQSTHNHLLCISKSQFLDDPHSILVVSPEVEEGEDGALAIQYHSENQTCPEGFYLLHIWSPTGEKSFDKLETIAKRLAKGSTLCVKYQRNVNHYEDLSGIDQRIDLIPPPSNDFSAEDCAEFARQLFGKLVQDAEFYPKRQSEDE